MRKLKQGESVSPMAPLGNNFRPPQPLHQRVVRTNIDLYPIDGRPETEDDAEGGTGQQCPSMQAKKFYQGKVVPVVRPQNPNATEQTENRAAS